MSTLNSGCYLARQGLALRGIFTERLEIHPYVKRLTKTFSNFFVCKHNMSLIFQRAGKKRVTAETPNPAFQDEIMEILCVSKLLKLEAVLIKQER